MTRKRLIGVLALAVILALWCWARRPNHWPMVNLPPSAAGPWVAFGDSLTSGVGAGEGANYPALLGARLGVAIENFGVSGHTTEDGLQRVEAVSALRPRVVLLCLGGNDGLNRLPRTAMFANLRTIIDRLQREGTFVVLLGVRSASLRDQNEKPFRQLAREKGCYYISDILRGVWGRPIYMSDALHPNEEGYARIADRLARELRPVIAQIQGTR